MPKDSPDKTETEPKPHSAWATFIRTIAMGSIVGIVGMYSALFAEPYLGSPWNIVVAALAGAFIYGVYSVCSGSLRRNR